MLTMLRTRVESLDGLRSGVTQEALDDRLAETDEALARLSAACRARSTRAWSPRPRPSRTRSTSSQHCTGTSRSPARASRRSWTTSARRSVRSRTRTGRTGCAHATGSTRRRRASPTLTNRVDAARGRSHRRPPRRAQLSASTASTAALEAVAVEIKRAKTTLARRAARSLEARLDDVASLTRTRRCDPSRRRVARRGRARDDCRRPSRRASRQPAGDGERRRGAGALPGRLDRRHHSGYRGHPAGDGRRSAGGPVTHERTRRTRSHAAATRRASPHARPARFLGTRADGLQGAHRARSAGAAHDAAQPSRRHPPGSTPSGWRRRARRRARSGAFDSPRARSRTSS